MEADQVECNENENTNKKTKHSPENSNSGSIAFLTTNHIIQLGLVSFTSFPKYLNAFNLISCRSYGQLISNDINDLKRCFYFLAEYERFFVSFLSNEFSNSILSVFVFMNRIHFLFISRKLHPLARNDRLAWFSFCFFSAFRTRYFLCIFFLQFSFIPNVFFGPWYFKCRMICHRFFFIHTWKMLFIFFTNSTKIWWIYGQFGGLVNHSK